MTLIRRLGSVLLFSQAVGFGLAADGPVLHLYPIPTAASGPAQSGYDPSFGFGVYFAERAANRIASVDSLGVVREFELPSPESGPYAVARTLDDFNRIAFTEVVANRIGFLDAFGHFEEVDIPTPASDPRGIAIDAAGAVWFTEYAADKIGFRGAYTLLEVVEFDLPPGSGPMGIALAPDGRMWFTEFLSGKIGSMDLIGARGEVDLPTPDSGPTSIALGYDGHLWFTEFLANRIGRVDLLGRVTEFAIPTPDSGPDAIRAAYDGFWFVERSANKIGWISLEGEVREYPLPEGGQPTALEFDDFSLWYPDAAGNSVGRVSGNLLYAIGAGAVGSWDSTFTLESGPDGPMRARVGLRPSNGACPMSCYDPGITLDLEPNTPEVVLASQVPHEPGPAAFQISRSSTSTYERILGLLPNVVCRIADSERRGHSALLPLVDHWTIADAQPPSEGLGRGAPQPFLEFPVRRGPGSHTNLVLTYVEGEMPTVRIDVVGQDGAVVRSFAPRGPNGAGRTDFFVDVLGIGVSWPFEGTLRITRVDARSLFWATLATVYADGRLELTSPWTGMTEGDAP